MEQLLKVSRTAFPDGSVMTYMNGMGRIDPENLGQIMKSAALESVCKNRNPKKVYAKPLLKLIKRKKIA